MSEAIAISRYLVRQFISIFDPTYIFFYKIFNNSYGPIPPMQNRVRVGGHYRIDNFIRSGRNCYEPIKKAIINHYSDRLNHLNILDFGAGCGRTLQFFYSDNSGIFATDVDSSAVDYLLKAFPKANANCNQYDPPLRYDNNFFDIVYSVSIWTHLPLSKQQNWLNEIWRILKFNGLALITVLGEFSLTRDRSARALDRYKLDLTPEKLEKEGIIYSEHPAVKFSHNMKSKILPGIDQSYGITFHAEEYIRNKWSEKFEVLEIQKGVIDNLQDLVVLRKK